MSLNHQLQYLELGITWNKSSTLIIIFKSKNNLLDPLNSPDEILIIYVKHIKHLAYSWCLALAHMENAVPPVRPLFIRASKKRGPWQGGESQPLAELGTASCGWLTGKLVPGCLATTTGWASLAKERSCPVCWGGSVHPGQMTKWI